MENVYQINMNIAMLILQILILGLIGGSVPGPILTAVFTEVINSGFKKSFKVVFRGLIAETIVALAVLSVIFVLKIPAIYFQVISVIGAAYLLWLASRLWKIKSIINEGAEFFNFSRIFLLTILNGSFWIFWITICVPLAFRLESDIPLGQFLFIAVFEFGWLLMVAILSFVFSRFRPMLLKKNLVSTAFRFFAVVLVFFALQSIYGAVRYMLK